MVWLFIVSIHRKEVFKVKTFWWILIKVIENLVFVALNMRTEEGIDDSI